ncbi:glycosyltransferase family 2 protein [Hydrogenovibrio thermophilus]|uniref:Glycosyltransferase n=1 Tax=Hydrogenovibrio thermophilus TaxID=265883 RepID=A0A410H4G6_9GAMM|nr:glycosyltransferase [Hydrogenovibrio thermophilus]QAB15786.1 glycosyltransferase [Hydrogenovibrio thermophilus]
MNELDLDYKDNFSVYSHVKTELVHGVPNFDGSIVSIMIPTFKRPHLLREAIESALNQNCDLKYNVIVVDNDDIGESWKDVEELVGSFNAENLYLFRNNQNIGMFGNWNRCIELCPTEKVIILNDDDLLDISFIAQMSLYMHENELVVCNHKKFGTKHREGNIKKALDKFKLFLEKLLKGKCYSYAHEDILFYGPTAGTLGVIFNKSHMKKIGGFDEAYFPISDYEFFYRYWKNFGVCKVNEVLASYRISENESLKIETLRNFLIKEYLLRNEILEEYPIGKRRKWLYSKLIKIIAGNYAVFWKSLNDDFNSYQEIKKIKLESYCASSLLTARIRSLFVYIVFSICSKVKNKPETVFRR